MGDFAIRAENLGKRYYIGQRRQPRPLRDTLTGVLGAPFKILSSCLSEQLLPDTAHESKGVIWALKNVSFEVERGEIIGLIGRNGAGKSTLLKILSCITEPTEGQAEIRGRFSSLLEVGTGFHSELTGRENIYLNGTIMGMRRAEIDKKFDEIVDFAEVEKFLETPVKHYSSGMYTRLAFAVAAHHEPEILLIDEALAVGDETFQKKCLGKMGEVAREGRTVLLVSHNLQAVKKLCRRAYLFEQGHIISSGDPVTVVDAYYRSTVDRGDGLAQSRDVPKGTVRFVDWSVESDVDDEHSCYTGRPCTFKFQLAVRRTVREANFGIALWTNDGNLIWAMRNLDYGGECVLLHEGNYEVQFSVPQLPLRPGSYRIQVSANDLREGNLDDWSVSPNFHILPKDESGLPLQWQGILNMTGNFNLFSTTDSAKGRRCS